MAQELRGGDRGAVLVLCLAAATFSISITSVVPALSSMGDELGVSVAAATWIFTSYLLASAALTPVFGHMGDAYGYRKVLLATLGLFAVGALVSSCTANLALIIAGRCIQGAGGAIIPLCLGVVRNQLDPLQRPSAVSAISATAGFGTGVGLVVGGLLSSTIGNRSIFVLSGVLAVASMCSLGLLPKQSSPRPAAIGFDAIGAALLTVGLVALMSGITLLGSTDQWLLLVAALLTAIVAFRSMIRWGSRGSTRPIIDLAANRDRRVLMTHVVTLLVAAGGFPIFVLAPLLVQNGIVPGGGLGLTELETGILLLPGCVGMMLVSASYGRLSRNTRAHTLMAVSSALVVIGMVLTATLAGSLVSLAIGCYLVLAGIGLHLSAAAGALVDHAPARLVAETTAVNTLLRNIGNALGAQACTISVAGVASHALPHTLAFAAPTAFALAGFVLCDRMR